MATAAKQVAGASGFDGVRLALLSNRFEGICRKMANTLLRTARSGVINIAHDFSCSILTADCDLLAVAESLPIHVLVGPDQMARTMKEFHPVLKRGDAFLHNSPYHGCSHPADHTILVPVIDDEGRHRFTVLAKAHQADCGNSIPTTYNGTARDVYEEGALIFPAVRVQRDYKMNDDIVRMCQMRIRVPEQWWGDFLAMIGSARIGEREILALANEIGWDTLSEFATQWFDYSEARMVEVIKALPKGRVTRTSTHDPIPGTPPGGIPVNATVEIKPEAGIIEVDLRDNIDSQPCGLNMSEACARSAAMIGVYNSIDHRVPKNAGSHRRLKVHLREGCVVGIPKHPTSCSVATTNVADRISNPVQAAMAEIKDGIGLAECGAIFPPSVGVISGVDERYGRRYVNQLLLGSTGGAGAPSCDAWMTICHVGNAGMIRMDSIEIDELRFPMVITARVLQPDSEGAGTFRGALASFVEYGPLGGTMEVAYVSDGSINAAQGTRGGLKGGASNQYKLDRDGGQQPLPATGVIPLNEGERIVAISTGGGGYGPPTLREPERVLADVRSGWVTPERARDVYGVAITPGFEIDQDATNRLRGSMGPSGARSA
ncbi:MAG: hydantoinase B/oxoprolinase family protein [Alphaproteobacteria bacterium]|nr:hydantoinase B/oxoprolinase family protein [Alphaproteobacteria bacterium]